MKAPSSPKSDDPLKPYFCGVLFRYFNNRLANIEFAFLSLCITNSLRGQRACAHCKVHY